MNASLSIAFIGLGRMGNGMARRLLAAGHALSVFDQRGQAALDQLDHEAASLCGSPAEVGANAEVIFLSLPGPKEVEAVVTASDGLLSKLRPGAVICDLSTNAVPTVRELSQRVAARGGHFLDCPVSGGPAGAASGKLAIWVGGEQAAFAQVEPLLRAIGDRVRHVGDSGAGTITKLVHNSSGYAINRVLAETFTMGVKAGIDPLTLFAAVRDGGLGRRRTIDGLIDQFLPNRYEPAAFALELAHKDVRLTLELAREVEVPMEMMDLAYADMTAALERGWNQRDSRSHMVLQLERAKVDIAVPQSEIARIVDEDK